MIVFRLVVVALFLTAASAAADPFRLALKISGVADLPDARARVYVYTANGASQPGLTTREFGPQERNAYSQWEVRIEGLRFADDSERGFFYADILDPAGSVVRRVPLTYFDKGSISSLGWLNADARALASADEVFRESYPTYLRETGLFTDENSDFLLLVFRTLVTKGFVTEEGHWARLFTFFTGNVRYFGDGGIDNISRILTFLEDRYDQDKANAQFVDFYLDLVSQILTLDLGGRSVPGYENLQDYVVARISIVFAEQPALAMNGVARALSRLNEDQKIEACFGVSLALMKTLSLATDLYAGIAPGSQLDLDFKRVMKRTVDCTQKRYALDDRAGPNAAVGNLAGGVEYLGADSEAAREMLRNFYHSYNKAEGLFPRRQDRGDWRQIYDYYDLIRASGVVAEQNS